MPESVGHRFLPRRILIVRLSALGDVIRTLPLLSMLRRRFPEARLSWLCEPGPATILEPQSELDEVIRFPRGQLAGQLGSGRLFAAARHFGRCTGRLRRGHFDLVLDAQGTYKSGLLMRLCGAPVRIGFGRGAAREFLPGAATHRVVPQPHRQSRVTKALALMNPLGGCEGTAEAGLPVDAQQARQAAALWGERHGPQVVLAPGASPRQFYKCWPPEHFAAAARLLGSQGARVAVAWGPGEESLARKVVDGAAGAATLLPATPLLLLAELLRSADLFIGNDSGPMHLSWLVGTPVVALYGPTDPVVNAPWGHGHEQVSVPQARRQALGRDPGLMAEIAPETVFEAAMRALAGA